jgi:hypothetical protein
LFHVGRTHGGFLVDGGAAAFLHGRVCLRGGGFLGRFLFLLLVCLFLGLKVLLEFAYFLFNLQESFLDELVEWFSGEIGLDLPPELVTNHFIQRDFYLIFSIPCFMVRDSVEPVVDGGVDLLFHSGIRQFFPIVGHELTLVSLILSFHSPFFNIIITARLRRKIMVLIVIAGVKLLSLNSVWRTPVGFSIDILVLRMVSTA